MTEQDQSRREGTGSWAQTITLIVAVLGILGTMATTILTDRLEDERRLEQERRQTYRALRTAASAFDDQHVEGLLERYRDTVVALLASEDASDGIPRPVTAEHAAQDSAFDAMHFAYLELESKIDDIRLIGSRRMIDKAAVVVEAARQYHNYLVGLENRLNDDYSEISVPRELRRLQRPSTWTKQRLRVAFRSASADYFSAAQSEVNRS
jgi:hypothetical protein